MLVIPAIDLRGGRAVRLLQGDAGRETVYDDDPVAVARRFGAQGAQRLHVVDLDGAFAGRSAHGALIARIAAVGVPVQTGGGVRDMETLEDLLGRGAGWVVLGTAAIEDRRFLSTALARHRERIIVAIDALDGVVRTRGWVEATGLTALALAREVHALGARSVIYTNIATDGMLTGPDLDGLALLAALAGLAVTASGGIGTIEHVRAVARLSKGSESSPPGVDACIIGKALYEGHIDLTAAIAAAA